MKFDLGHLYLDKLSLDLTSILEEFEPARRITIGSTVQDANKKRIMVMVVIQHFTLLVMVPNESLQAFSKERHQWYMVEKLT